ncbi:CLUMA_CG004565, isoform A [Clunio marinus]|uniref:CLUMA_CG004565, isoform A n=1 Tax=Clunio marinus TaxID=568069 RepID=A0A1J1HSC2_9DIPT|nr:CLUMA_CG004565, isoform A [Clunio marinus]
MVKTEIHDRSVEKEPEMLLTNSTLSRVNTYFQVITVNAFKCYRCFWPFLFVGEASFVGRKHKQDEGEVWFMHKSIDNVNIPFQNLITVSISNLSSRKYKQIDVNFMQTETLKKLFW